MASYITMLLKVGGVETIIWQKFEIETQTIITAQKVSYVDAQGSPTRLPNTYEMIVVNGIEHDVLGII